MRRAASGERREKTARTPLANLGHALGAPALDRDFARTLVVLLPAAVLAVMGYHRRWMSDDGFIDLHVVRNLLAGHGPLYNVDERVEAYTNPLWVAILAVWGAFGGPLEIGSVGLGLAFSVLGLLAAQAAAVRLARRVDGVGSVADGSLALPVGASVFAAVPAAWDYATSGLETGLGFGWLGLSYWLLVRVHCPEPNPGDLFAELRGQDRRWRVGTAVVLGLGPLIRPDLAVFSAGFLGVLLAVEAFPTERGGNGAADSRGRRRAGLLGAAGLMGAAALLPVVYQVFRMGYFAGIVPNTALAKEAGAANWVQGRRYAADFASAYALAIPLVVLLGWWVARTLRAGRHRDGVGAALLLAPVLAGALHAHYVIRVGGDFMHARMLLPSLFAALLPMATVVVPPGGLRAWPRPSLPAVAAAVVAVWAIACGFTMRVPYAGKVSAEGIADERGFYTTWAGRSNPVWVDDYARANPHHDGLRLREQVAALGASERVLVIDGPPVEVRGYEAGIIPLAATAPVETALVSSYQQAGIVAYVAGPRVHIADRFGLADPIASRLRIGANRGRPGHEKVLSNVWIIGRFAQLLPNAPPEVVAAHAALRCGDLGKLARAVTEPMSVGRFFANVRLAWRLYRLRVPADPLIAEAEFCGTASATTTQQPAADTPGGWDAASLRGGRGACIPDRGRATILTEVVFHPLSRACARPRRRPTRCATTRRRRCSRPSPAISTGTSRRWSSPTATGSLPLPCA